ncbi:MAG: extracellular solute-binding protein [Verrucomicrobia bacterium]|nr:extracellular solute-binding protein [Verrucomicrobiota bacterium]
MPPILRRVLAAFSPGVGIIALLAVAAAVALLLLPQAPRERVQFWIFAKQHQAVYQSLLERWNREHPGMRVEMSLVNGAVMDQRIMSGFLTGTPVADVLEVERSMAGKAFMGPIEDVGYVDLTARLKSEGLLAQINRPSLSPWTSRGHIFGIPHDVHPVMLMYRADLVEAAGIDVRQIETWDDFIRVMRPLQQDLDGDGRIDRQLLSYSPIDPNGTEVLMLQAGGRIFDDQEQPCFDRPGNAAILARLASWSVGPHQICRYADYNLASGQQLLVDGLVVAVMAPDWLCGTFKQQIPGLGGKVKLMPLPAWERGGRRTSVFGGTMLALTKASLTPEEDWEFAKAIYLSREMATALFRSTCIISPFKANWTDAAYDEPDPYFRGQPVGRLYVRLAPDVPRRTSSPYNPTALLRLSNCMTSLVAYAEERRLSDPAALEAEAQRLLVATQRDFAALVHRNAFLRAPAR